MLLQAAGITVSPDCQQLACVFGAPEGGIWVELRDVRTWALLHRCCLCPSSRQQPHKQQLSWHPSSGFLAVVYAQGRNARVAFVDAASGNCRVMRLLDDEGWPLEPGWYGELYSWSSAQDSLLLVEVTCGQPQQCRGSFCLFDAQGSVASRLRAPRGPLGYGTARGWQPCGRCILLEHLRSRGRRQRMYWLWTIRTGLVHSLQVPAVRFPLALAPTSDRWLSIVRDTTAGVSRIAVCSQTGEQGAQLQLVGSCEGAFWGHGDMVVLLQAVPVPPATYGKHFLVGCLVRGLEVQQQSWSVEYTSPEVDRPWTLLSPGGSHLVFVNPLNSPDTVDIVTVESGVVLSIAKSSFYYPAAHRMCWSDDMRKLVFYQCKLLRGWKVPCWLLNFG